MPPRSLSVPRGTFASHSKHLQHRLRPQLRSASTVNDASPWRGKDPFTRVGQSITGGMEWQTSTYSYNKQASRTLPVATANVEKLLQAYVTMKEFDSRKTDARAIRAALAARRKSATKMYVSKPRIKDFGDRVEVTAFIFDGRDAANDAGGRQQGARDAQQRGQSGAKSSAAELLMKPSHKAGIESLLARIYNKPTALTLVRLTKPHLDADILAAVVTQRLRDRRNTPRRVIRDATWKAPLPSAQTIASIQQAKEARLAAGGTKFSWQDMTLGSAAQTTASSITDGLGLSQVSSVEVQAAGRLTKRLTANRSQRKMARRGANAKGPAYMLRGFRKAHLQNAFASGKRRVGQYGIRVLLGHT